MNFIMLLSSLPDAWKRSSVDTRIYRYHILIKVATQETPSSEGGRMIYIYNMKES